MIFPDDSRLVVCEFIVLHCSVLYYSVLYCVITVLGRLFDGVSEDSSSVHTDTHGGSAIPPASCPPLHILMIMFKEIKIINNSTRSSCLLV